MRKIRRGLYWLVKAVLFMASFSYGQGAVTADATADVTIEDALHRMSDQAGIVFLGEVVAVRHIAGEGGASGVVEVEFRVDQAVRGCTGPTYVLREWAGLWSGGDQRYRVGQHLLMLLHAPGAGGVTSPVGGMAGAIPIRGSASLIQATATAASAASSAVADLRWVGTRLQRAMVYRDSSTPVATPSSSSRAVGVNDGAGDASTASQQAPVMVVVNMLAAWQKKNVR